MHPRNLLSPLRDSVFHVTNNGWSSCAPSSFCSAVPRDVTLVPALLVELVPLGVDAALDELALKGERRRDMAAGLAGESVSSSAFSVVLGSVLYFFQRASTWRRESAGRFSREAARLSKQYAQWASVAMVLVGFWDCSTRTPLI